MSNLFAYGSLMCADIMTSVVGSERQRNEGGLKGYQRLKLQNEQYPAIIEGENCEVKGIVYSDIDETGWRKLDSFEGAMYKRQIVEVEIPNEGILYAYTYVLRPEYHHRILHEEWSFSEFVEHGKGVFVSNYFGYDEID